MEEVKIVTPEEKNLRREIEDLFLSCPTVDFVGVAGEVEELEGRIVITLGTSRPRLLGDLLGPFLQKIQSMLPTRSYRVVIVRGRVREEAKK